MSTRSFVLLGLAALCAAGAGAADEPLVTADTLLKDPTFRQAYTSALGGRAKDRWLARLDMSSPLRTIRLGGEDWRVATPCKPHDCADNNLFLVYQAKRGVVHGVLHEKGRETLVGSPAPALVPELQRLWKKEFRQQ